MCVYQGPLCTNGARIIVAADVHEGRSAEYYADDGRHRCLDYRYFDKRDACGYTGPFERANLPVSPLLREKPHAWFWNASSLFSAPVHQRRWGPDDHGHSISAVPWEALAAVTTEKAMAKLPKAWREAAWDVTSARVAEAQQQPGGAMQQEVTGITWANAGGYMNSYDGGWMDHPWHFATAAFGLWDAKRQNFTVTNIPLWDGAPGPLNMSHGAMELPPMDYYVALGDYHPPRHGMEELGKWAQAVLPLLVQEHTKIVLNGMLTTKYSVTDSHFMCFTQGVITAVKPRVFTGVADANAFRLAAYAAAGVPTHAFPARPPRKITIMARVARSFSDMDMILRVVNDTGLPWQVVPELREFTWEEQVRLMAETGIMIAPHGGALGNVMFMSSRSVLIEAFPYLLHFTMYQRLAEVAGLTYYKIRGTRPTIPEGQPDPWDTFSEPDFIYDCEYPYHTSSIDATLHGPCNGKSKYSQIHIHEWELRHMLDNALDDIACKDGVCREEENGAVFYHDMHSGQRWQADGVWDPEKVSMDDIKRFQAASRALSGRVRYPGL